MKKAQVFMVLAGLVLSGSVMALDWKVTTYDLVDKSLSTLLNEGWAIRSYAIDSGLSTGLSAPRSFILEKGGKCIECSMQANLQAGQGKSRCFSLNWMDTFPRVLAVSVMDAAVVCVAGGGVLRHRIRGP